jgi:murein DD-endopeptidase MepM/ murein hydrolase activator NlpD
MNSDKDMVRSLGMEPPILADGRRAPDRREISLRWLAGTCLTGLTSSVLMGVALFAALDGRQQLAIPAEAYARTEAPSGVANMPDAVSRGGRLVVATVAAKPTDKSIMSISTMVKEGEKNIIRRQPFAHVKMQLAANHTIQQDYPAFDAMKVFASGDQQAAPAEKAPVLYGSDVESEVSLKLVPFPLTKTKMTFTPTMSLDEVEENVRTNGSVLTDGDAQVASLFYVDPQRFAAGDQSLDIPQGLTAKVVDENVTVTEPQIANGQTPEYADDIIPVRETVTISDAMTSAGYSRSQAFDVANKLIPILNSDELRAESVLRIGIIQQKDQASVVRASVYYRGSHVASIALDDKGHFVSASEPAKLDSVATAFDEDTPQIVDNGDLPRVYDGIYRAAISYGMTMDMTSRIIKLLASSVDFQAKLKPTDTMEAFFSVEDESGKATADSELLYLSAKFGDQTIKLYRFQNPDDNSVDYFDQDGKSLKQFLIRNPVPNGVFKSGFGMRRHPILGYLKMHTGTDWAAPRGTPIIAAGDGIVEKAGWDSGGYGNQTLIQHANGYVTSYNHQSAIAKNVVPGAKIVQGQVIGWIGTTGLSTGPHLHYEVIVNGNKVDPLRIRLPGGQSLQGSELATFETERKRIDDLLTKDNEQVAAK